MTMTGKSFALSCSVDSATFTSASTALIHYKGKKHRSKMRSFMKNPQNESMGLFIRDASKIPMVNILTHLSTLGNIQTVHLEDGFGINETYYASAVVFFDSAETVNIIRQSRHTIGGVTLPLSRYLINDDPSRPPTPPPSMISEPLDHKIIEDNLRQLQKSGKELDDQILELTNLIQIKPNELTMRRELCVQLQEHLRTSVSPYCEVASFGSTNNNLALQGGDLDLSIHFKQGLPVRHDDESFESWRERLKEKERSLIVICRTQLKEKHKDFASNVKTTCDSNSGIVKFTHRATGIRCFLYFRNRLANQNTDFLSAICAFDGRVRPLIMTIKYWFKIYGLSGRDNVGKELSISSYALTVMVVFLLQREDILPSIKQLHDSLTTDESEKVERWQTGFGRTFLSKPKPEKSHRRAISRLMYKFFDLFSNFDYNSMVVSPYLGKQFTKDIFGTPKKCRQTMPTYAYLVDSGKAPPLKFNTPLVVQDPFELNKNLTHQLSSEGLSIFKKMCRAAKEDFPTSKLYRLWNLNNIPKKLKQLVEEKNRSLLKSEKQRRDDAEAVEKKLLLELGLQEGSEVKSFNGDGDSTLEAVNKMIDGVDCDDSDRLFLVNYIPDECHVSYKSLLEADPNRRMKDKFLNLVEFILENLLVKTLRFEKNGEEPPPAEFLGDEPELKRPRKSRWDSEDLQGCDRERLSEMDFSGFYPVWEFRKLTRKTFELYDKTLEAEQAISERIVERCHLWRQHVPLTTFKVWSHHSKRFEGAVCVHMMDNASQRGVWGYVINFAKEFLPFWTKNSLFYGDIGVDVI